MKTDDYKLLDKYTKEYFRNIEPFLEDDDKKYISGALKLSLNQYEPNDIVCSNTDFPCMTCKYGAGCFLITALFTNAEYMKEGVLSILR